LNQWKNVSVYEILSERNYNGINIFISKNIIKNEIIAFSKMRV